MKLTIEKSVGLEQVQIELADSLFDLVEEYGEFDSTAGAEGAHFFPADKNPFQAEGVKCGNCIFYDGTECAIVDAPVTDGSLCKFWIIPEGLLQGQAAAEAAAEDAADAASGMEEGGMMQMVDKAWGSVFTPLV
jgi:hypothetical protein